MNRIIILGAGATRGASTANKELLPPLLKDFPSIFNPDFISLNSSKDGALIKGMYNDLIRISCTADDLEEFFTILFRLERAASCINPSFVFMNEEQMQQIIQNDISVRKFFQDEDDLVRAKSMLEYYIKTPQSTVLACPANLKTFVHRALYEYLYHAISHCYCDYHAKLFETLDVGDAVVSFNYDEICDFTLYRKGKLSERSFDNLGFRDIVFPDEQRGLHGVTFLKMHGSFNWWSDLKAAPYKHVYYNLVSQASNKNLKGDLPFFLILPFHHKQIIYESYDIYKNHINRFQDLLENATEIFLVGKTFLNTDKEMNELIQACSRHKRKILRVIDPKILDEAFIEHHRSLFNAHYESGWNSFEEFYKDTNVI